MGFIQVLHQGSDGCDMIETVHDEPFHLNRQLKSIGWLRLEFSSSGVGTSFW